MNSWKHNIHVDKMLLCVRAHMTKCVILLETCSMWVIFVENGSSGVFSMVQSLLESTLPSTKTSSDFPVWEKHAQTITPHPLLRRLALQRPACLLSFQYALSSSVQFNVNLFSSLKTTRRQNRTPFCICSRAQTIRASIFTV